jgi:hypothetical protein
MKPNWGKFLQKTTHNPAVKRLCGENIELVSDDLALEVRGGDKDYSPTYEYEAEKKEKFTNPSFLLRL